MSLPGFLSRRTRREARRWLAVAAAGGALTGCAGGNVIVHQSTASVAPPGSVDIVKPSPLLDQPSVGVPVSVTPRGELRPRALVLLGGPTASLTQNQFGLGLDTGFLYDWNPEKAFQHGAERGLAGFGLGLGGRLLSGGDNSPPHVGTLFAEARFGLFVLDSRHDPGNIWNLLGAGWAWDPSRGAQGPSESICVNNFCGRFSHFLGKGTEFQFLIDLPLLGIRRWSD